MMNESPATAWQSLSVFTATVSIEVKEKLKQAYFLIRAVLPLADPLQHAGANLAEDIIFLCDAETNEASTGTMKFPPPRRKAG